ncbi:hypothetical protein [Flavobacterium sp. DG1-102-2]|uniref:hypothetical protein n=1 Tax=Flavobacterium sp. DG1-102-2 TaxID=3081663 RepID=UPI00294AE63A|nr:hypothetical protein [Flavobacterium sp. DG1-102-2]
MKSALGVICTVNFIISALCATFIHNRMIAYAEKEINSIIKASPQVYVNGKTHSKEILDDIKNIKKNSGSRVWSDSVISIKMIKDKTVIEINAFRNRDDSILYSIYYPKYNLTRINAIGEIRTKQLNDY